MSESDVTSESRRERRGRARALVRAKAGTGGASACAAASACATATASGCATATDSAPASAPASVLRSAAARRGARRPFAAGRAALAALVAAAAGTGGLPLPSPLAAQDSVEALAARCAGDDEALLAACREGALAVQATQAMVGLLAAGGAQVPGASSTLGRRFGGVPRFSASARGSLLRVDVPDVREGEGLTFPGRSALGLGAQGSLALGLLDGFSLIPTVGGVLSLDAFATAGLLLLPGGRGFRDDPLTWGVGANLGLLRESFTLPGVTVSVARRGMTGTSFGDRAAGDAAELRVRPSVTSVRGVAGKDLLALGVLVGAGWDRYRTGGTLAVSGPDDAVGQANPDGFTSSRALFFGGLSLNLLILQLSAEGGWARGFEAAAGRPAGGYDPAEGSLFLSAAARLTL